MKTLKEKFGELSAKIKASGQPARVWFPQYTPASLLSAENWWEALAVCEYALDTKEDEKLTEDFFELIFSAFDTVWQSLAVRDGRRRGHNIPKPVMESGT